MKIGYLMPEWPGPSHVWAWREILHLRELGLEVTIFSTRRPQELGKHDFVAAAEAETLYLWPLGLGQILLSVVWALLQNPKGFLACIQLGLTLPVYHQPAWKSVLPLIVPACRFAQEVKFRQIEHLHTPIPGNSAILLMLVKRLVHVPFSLTVVAAFEDWGGALQEKFEDATFITLVAEWMVDQMAQDFPSMPPERYCVTRHGVDIAKWRPDPSQKSANSDPNRILSIGRLTFNKGFDILLKAVAIVKKRGIPFQLRIAGSGPERPHLETLIRELDLNADVVLLGAIGEEACLAEAQAADLFVLASHKEPLGVVYLEAMAAEVATIGTAAGGVVEIITDQSNGLLVPPNQVEALAEAIARLLTDDRLRQQLAKAGRQTVIERFDSRIGAAALYELIMQSAAAGQSLDKI